MGTVRGAPVHAVPQASGAEGAGVGPRQAAETSPSRQVAAIVALVSGPSAVIASLVGAIDDGGRVVLVPVAVAAIVQGCDVSVYATSDREGLDVLVWAHLRPAQPDARTPPEIQRRLRDWYTRHDKADLDDRVRALLWAMGEQEGLELAGCLLGLSSGLAGDHDLGGRWWARLSRLVVREHGAAIDSADLVYAALTMGLVPLDDAELTAWQRAGLRVAVKTGMAHRGEVATWEVVASDDESDGETREAVGPRELPCIGCDDEGYR